MYADQSANVNHACSWMEIVGRIRRDLMRSLNMQYSQLACKPMLLTQVPETEELAMGRLHVACIAFIRGSIVKFCMAPCMEEISPFTSRSTINWPDWLLLNRLKLTVSFCRPNMSLNED
jgi:hypothetical protein